MTGEEQYTFADYIGKLENLPESVTKIGEDEGDTNVVMYFD